MLTSSRIGIVLAACSARWLISCARRRLSTLWTISNSSTASRHLLVCKWPIICQRRWPGQSGIFAFASCTLLSPNRFTPSSATARTASGGWLLLTGSKVTVAGFLLVRAQAASIRLWISFKLAAKSMANDLSRASSGTKVRNRLVFPCISHHLAVVANSLSVGRVYLNPAQPEPEGAPTSVRIRQDWSADSHVRAFQASDQV